MAPQCNRQMERACCVVWVDAKIALMQFLHQFPQLECHKCAKQMSTLLSASLHLSIYAGAMLVLLKVIFS